MATPDTGENSLIGRKHVVGAVVLGALTIVVVGGLLALLLIKPHDSASWYDLARTAGLLLAALGAVPAGYIAYRRQQALEGQRDVDSSRQALAVKTEFRLQEAEKRRILERDRSDAATIRQEFRGRYGDAALQLGNANPAVRLAGVYAMSQLADDWAKEEPSQRQTCVNVLCAYLRVRQEVADVSANAISGEQQVRSTVMEVILDHLRKDRPATAPEGWHRLNFNLAGAVLENTILDDILVSGVVRFDSATFSGPVTSFQRMSLIGADVSFRDARFDSASTVFDGLVVSGSKSITFENAVFSGSVTSFNNATIEASLISFENAKTTNPDSILTFTDTGFTGNITTFNGVQLVGKECSFFNTKWHSKSTTINGCKFAAQETSFEGSSFGGGSLSMVASVFASSRSTFQNVTLSPNMKINLYRATYVNTLVLFDGTRRAAQEPSELRSALGVR